jgi:RimJ/RimL family protein N-acetyltransferase
MEPVELREDGLLLRPWRREDADAVDRATADPAMPRLLRSAALAAVTGQPAPDATMSLGVFDARAGDLLGTAGLVRIDRADGQAELGYWTAPTARGRGVATAAARAVARHAARAGLRRVLWRARVGNHLSRLVAVRIGVRFEGVQRASVRTGDGWADAWIGSLLPGELREADALTDPALERAAIRCRTFGSPQPTVLTETKDGQTVRLRPLRSADVPACVRACNDPLTARYTTVPQPYDAKHAESFINVFAPGMWARGTEAVFAIADADDALVGTMALRLPGDELVTPTGDVGYLIGPWARGRGYASAALRALTDWGFANLALRRIEWQAYVGNTASRATAERAGFRVEGELREALQHRGDFMDAWIGARLAPDR